MTDEQLEQVVGRTPIFGALCKIISLPDIYRQHADLAIGRNIVWINSCSSPHGIQLTSAEIPPELNAVPGLPLDVQAFIPREHLEFIGFVPVSMTRQTKAHHLTWSLVGVIDTGLPHAGFIKAFTRSDCAFTVLVTPNLAPRFPAVEASYG